MRSSFELVSFLTRAENRVEVLLTLAAGPRTRPDLQDETDIPRATLSRILADLRDRELVSRNGHRYRVTPLGDLVAVELESLFESVESTRAPDPLQVAPARGSRRRVRPPRDGGGDAPDADRPDVAGETGGRGRG